MTLNEFLEYLEENLSGYEVFAKKATEYQQMKNGKRPPAKRWNDVKIQRAVNLMWKQSMSVLYEQIKSEIGKNAYDPKAAWIKYMQKSDILESVSEGISEMEFE